MQVCRLALNQFYNLRNDIEALLKESMAQNFSDYVIDNEYYSETLKNVERYIEDGSAIIYIAMEGENIYGWIWCYEIHRFNKRRLHIANFAVRKNNRKNGIGKQLILMAEKYAYENGFSGIDLLVTKDNISAVRFYEKQGYEIERYTMRKELCNDRENSFKKEYSI